MASHHLKLDGRPRRTIIVGDIHGCFKELRKLLKQVDFGPEDRLLAVGDLVDRGPGTWDVARFFRETPNAHSVLGNHERRLAGVVRGTLPPAWTQLHSLHHLPAAQHEDWAAWLENLPAVIETEDVVITHSRLDPDRALDNQDPHHTCAVGGQAVVIETDADDIPRWFHAWRRAQGDPRPICFGHSRHRQVELVKKRLYALDTGAARGFSLTALLLPEFQVIRVPVPRDHAALAQLEWESILLDRLDPERVPIHQYLAWRRKSVPGTFAAALVGEVKQHLADVGLAATLEELRERLRHRYGPLPAAGPERGRYFQEARRDHGPGTHRLLNYLLSQRPLRQKAFLELYKGKDLGTALSLLRKMRSVLDEQD